MCFCADLLMHISDALFVEQSMELGRGAALGHGRQLARPRQPRLRGRRRRSSSRSGHVGREEGTSLDERHSGSRESERMDSATRLGSARDEGRWRRRTGATGRSDRSIRFASIGFDSVPSHLPGFLLVGSGVASATSVGAASTSVAEGSTSGLPRHSGAARTGPVSSSSSNSSRSTAEQASEQCVLGSIAAPSRLRVRAACVACLVRAQTAAGAVASTHSSVGRA